MTALTVHPSGPAVRTPERIGAGVAEEIDVGGRGRRDRGLHRRRASRAGTLTLVVLLVAAGLAGYAARRHPELLVAAGVRQIGRAHV